MHTHLHSLSQQESQSPSKDGHEIPNSNPTKLQRPRFEDLEKMENDDEAMQLQSDLAKQEFARHKATFSRQKKQGLLEKVALTTER